MYYKQPGSEFSVGLHACLMKFGKEIIVIALAVGMFSTNNMADDHAHGNSSAAAIK